MNAFEESPWLQDLLNDEPTLNGTRAIPIRAYLQVLKRHTHTGEY